jgi:formate dehydrogenase beta subunit
LECIKTKLGEPDQGGQKKQAPVKGSEFVIDADMIISAVDPRPDLGFCCDIVLDMTQKGAVKVHPDSFMTTVTGVFAGGDVVSGPATVIEAIASGRQAALAIDRYLSGKDPISEKIVSNIIPIEDVDVNRFRKRLRQKSTTLSVEERVVTMREVGLGFQNLEAMREADRCFQCGLFPKKPDTE